MYQKVNIYGNGARWGIQNIIYKIKSEISNMKLKLKYEKENLNIKYRNKKTGLK